LLPNATPPPPPHTFAQWELYSGAHAFKGIPRALLGHEVAHQQRRPQFPDDCPFDFQLLACRCVGVGVGVLGVGLVCA
jgi:hypothetical protein